jgi:hypothetical protein
MMQGVEEIKAAFNRPDKDAGAEIINRERVLVYQYMSRNNLRTYIKAIKSERSQFPYGIWIAKIHLEMLDDVACWFQRSRRILTSPFQVSPSSLVVGDTPFDAIVM